MALGAECSNPFRIVQEPWIIRIEIHWGSVQEENLIVEEQANKVRLATRLISVLLYFYPFVRQENEYAGGLNF